MDRSPQTHLCKLWLISLLWMPLLWIWGYDRFKVELPSFPLILARPTKIYKTDSLLISRLLKVLINKKRIQTFFFNLLKSLLVLNHRTISSSGRKQNGCLRRASAVKTRLMLLHNKKMWEKTDNFERNFLACFRLTTEVQGFLTYSWI